MFINLIDWFKSVWGRIVRKSAPPTQNKDRHTANKQAKRKAKNRAAKQARKRNRNK